jgi:hypothetical protein
MGSARARDQAEKAALAAARRARLPWPLRGAGARTRSSLRDEDEVRDVIYGWHSGTVEPPEPLDSACAPVSRQPASLPGGDDGAVA